MRRRLRCHDAANGQIRTNRSLVRYVFRPCLYRSMKERVILLKKNTTTVYAANAWGTMKL